MFANITAIANTKNAAMMAKRIKITNVTKMSGLISQISVGLALILSAMILSVSCGGRGNSAGNSNLHEVEMQYAKGLKILEGDDYTIVEVLNPWDTTSLLHRYVLVEEAKKGGRLPEGTVITVPVENVAVYSSVHASIIEHLDMISSIKGICESEYMVVQSVKDELAKGNIKDLGSSVSPNIERIISENIKAIIATPYANASYGAVSTLGIPIIEGADYMETHPLGRTEWIKFYSRLYNKKELGDSLYKNARNWYESLRDLVKDSKVGRNPSVMREKKYGAQWNVPGGNSYMAILFRDAGADYIYADDTQRGSLVLSLEAMIEAGATTDMWMIKYNSGEDITYRSLPEEFAPYKNFKSFKEKKIYACNTGKIPYYEETTMHPYLLLENFIMIFHPEIVGSKEMRYFTPIN